MEGGRGEGGWGVGGEGGRPSVEIGISFIFWCSIKNKSLSHIKKCGIYTNGTYDPIY